MSSACISARTPPTATTVFIYDAYTLRRTVVRALGHTAARKYDRYFAIAENPILINALLRKNAVITRTKETKARLPTNLYDSRPA